MNIIEDKFDNTVYAYIAGFFDGEGWIGTRSDNRKEPPLISLGISITNTNLEVLIKIKNVFGGHIKQFKERENRKKAFGFEITDRVRLNKFLKEIYPYTIVKRQQIEYGLKFLELTANSQHGSKGLSLEEIKIRNFFSDKLKEMKDVEYTDEELKIFEEKINELNEDKNQPTIDKFVELMKEV